MFELILTRKRDGYKNWIAGSQEFGFSYKSALNLVKLLKKSAGALENTAGGLWENGLVEVRILDCKGAKPDLSIPTWVANEWTKEKL